MDILDFDPNNIGKCFTTKRKIMTFFNKGGYETINIFEKVFVNGEMSIVPVQLDEIKTFVHCTDISVWEVWNSDIIIPKELLADIGAAIEDYDA